MDRWTKLAYDVGVNVAANLIAAALIYLGGLAFGLFPPTYYYLAASVVGSALLLGAMAASFLHTRGRFAMPVVFGLWTIMQGTLLLAPDSPEWAGPAFLALGISMPTMMIMWTLRGVPLGRRPRRNDDY